MKMDDGSLQLNINTNASSSKSKWNETQKFEHKLQNSNTRDNQTCDNNLKRSRQHGKVPFSGEVISSLFNSNPISQTITRNAVKPTKEDIFVSESFDLLSLHPFMTSNLESSYGIKLMTVVQKKAIPPILQGNDVLIKSQTGSGKTLAFAIPIIQKLQEERPKLHRSDGIACVIVVPTRELALQSYECFIKLLKPFTWIVAGCLMGGEKKKSEKSRIRKGFNILISTPGRLVDHLKSTKNLKLNKVKWLVLDEADRLLDMGYERDLSEIIETLNLHCFIKKRQTIMVSATLSKGVDALAGLTLESPRIIDISAYEEKQPLGRLVIPECLRQAYTTVPMKLRLVTLAAFILWKCRFSNEKKFLIFISSQDMVDFHTQLFIHVLHKALNESDDFFDDPNALLSHEEEMDESEDSVGIFRLHGNMMQKERNHVFLKMKETAAAILICTDVAARGLDLPQVHWIVQYSAPSTPVDYVHRVGRTARIGSSGNALLFLLPSEIGFIKNLEDENIGLEEMKMENILEKLTSTLVSSEPTKVKGKRTRMALTMEESATALQLRFENAVLNDQELKESARKAFVSYVRSYASYPSSVRHIFNMKSVHLGHLAKSLGLRENPSAVGASISSAFKATDRPKKKRPRVGGETVVRRPLMAEVSEFASGLDDVPPLSKRKKTMTAERRKHRISISRRY